MDGARLSEIAKFQVRRGSTQGHRNSNPVAIARLRLRMTLRNNLSDQIRSRVQRTELKRAGFIHAGGARIITTAARRLLVIVSDAVAIQIEIEPNIFNRSSPPNRRVIGFFDVQPL